MSHFMVMVLIPEKMKVSMIEKEISKLLSPYDESMEVDEYMRDCGCIGLLARRAAKDVEGKRFGKCDSVRELYWKKVKDGEIKEPKDFDDNSTWRVFARIDEREKFSNDFEKNHPMYKKTDPNCDECKGTGKHPSTYNPMSKWDGWCIGGRWTGAFDEKYKPEDDPRNKEKCWLCNGTGFRTDEVANKIRKTDPDFKCNGCKDGVALKWPSSWASFDGDIKPVREIINPKAYAIVTPDAKWHEKGKMGWWGISTDEKGEIIWQAEKIALLAEHQDCLAVCVDCHI